MEWDVYRTVAQPVFPPDPLPDPLPDPWPPDPLPDEHIGKVRIQRSEIFNKAGDGTIELSPALHQRLVLRALWDNPAKVRQYLDGKKLTDTGIEVI